MDKAYSRIIEKKQPLLLGIILVGVFNALSGGFVILDYCNRISTLPSSVGVRVLSSIISKAGLVALEASFCFIISFLSLVILSMKDRARSIKNIAILSLCLKIVLTFIIYIPYGKQWYYIFDPAAHNGSILIGLFSGIQLILQIVFTVGICRSGKFKEKC